MKKDNLVIFIAFIILVIVIFASSIPKKSEEIPSSPKNTNQQTEKKSALGLIKQIKFIKQEPFGIYQKYIPYIKALAEYAKWHQIPITNPQDYRELAELDKSQKISGISSHINMNIIDLYDGYYIKVLQNTIAIYNNKIWYHIDFSLDGEATCVGKFTPGYQACQAMGGTDPEPNNKIPTWIAYKLPTNLFD